MALWLSLRTMAIYNYIIIYIYIIIYYRDRQINKQVDIILETQILNNQQCPQNFGGNK